MATRRRRRRRNPVRATGALVLNPRRRRRPTRKRRTTTRRRSNTSKAARSRAAKLGWRRRRRNGTKTGQRRKTARRAYSRRRNGTKTGMRRKTARRAYMRRRNTRKGQYRKTARRAYRRRRNVGQVTKLKQSLRKVPLVGNSLASMVGFAPHAVFGAVSTEPTMMAVKFAAPYAPKLNSSVFYGAMGLLVATLIHRFAPVKPALRDKLAVAAASAAGGIAYYKWRTGGDQSLAGEYGMLSGYGSELEVLADGYGSELEVLADGYGGYGSELEVLADGMGYETLPFSQTAGYGAELEVLSGASLADAYSAVGDMTPDEVEEMAGWGAAMQRSAPALPAFTRPTITARPAFRPGPRRRPFRGRRFQRRGRQHLQQSRMAGQRCHRWAWLRCLVGPQRFQQIRTMPPQQRREIISDLKQAAISAVESMANNSQPDFDPSMDEGDMSGYGALIYGT